MTSLAFNPDTVTADNVERFILSLCKALDAAGSEPKDQYSRAQTASWFVVANDYIVECNKRRKVKRGGLGQLASSRVHPIEIVNDFAIWCWTQYGAPLHCIHYDNPTVPQFDRTRLNHTYHQEGYFVLAISPCDERMLTRELTTLFQTWPQTGSDP